MKLTEWISVKEMLLLTGTLVGVLAAVGLIALGAYVYGRARK